MGKKAGLSSANSQEQVKARVSRVKQAPAHDWLARVAMKFEVLEGLYPDSRKAGTNNFDLTPFSMIAARPKRRRYGSYLGEISPAPDNLIERDFTAAAPKEKLLTDISEFQIPAGKVCVSPMIDCFDGQVVSWSIGTRPDAELVNTMLDAAIETVSCSDNKPVVHSDRGAHYRWP